MGKFFLIFHFLSPKPTILLVLVEKFIVERLKSSYRSDLPFDFTSASLSKQLSGHLIKIAAVA